MHTTSVNRTSTLETTRGRRGSPVADLIALLLTWRRRAVSRRVLGQMDERALADIGLSVTDAAAEAAKPFWRI